MLCSQTAELDLAHIPVVLSPEMAKKKKAQPQRKSRRRINWSQVIFGLIAGAMILTMLLSMIQ
jgi:hypothetical protein